MQELPILDDFTPQDALVAVMVGVSAADENLTTGELLSIARMVDSLPAFDGYDHERIKLVSHTVFHLYEREDGIDILFDRVRRALTQRLYETAYALACDVAAADGHAFQVELQYLLELRHTLDVERLTAAAIEKGAAARHRRIDPPEA